MLDSCKLLLTLGLEPVIGGRQVWSGEGKMFWLENWKGMGACGIYVSWMYKWTSERPP
jgi:hypothetical protein